MATQVITVDNGGLTDFGVIGQEITVDALTGITQYVRPFCETATRSSVASADRKSVV